MTRRPNPTIVVCLCALLLLQSAGCASSRSSLGHTDKSEPSTEYLPTRDALETLDTSTKVTVVLRDGATLKGLFEGMDDIPARRVYIVPLKYLPEVTDSLRAWIPVHGESVTIYTYPSREVFEESRTNLSIWGGDLRIRHPGVHFMTPKITGDTRFTVCLLSVPQYGTFAQMSKLPSDSICVILVDRDQPIGKAEQAAIGTVVGVVGFLVVAGMITGLWMMGQRNGSGWW